MGGSTFIFLIEIGPALKIRLIVVITTVYYTIVLCATIFTYDRCQLDAVVTPVAHKISSHVLQGGNDRHAQRAEVFQRRDIMIVSEVARRGHRRFYPDSNLKSWFDGSKTRPSIFLVMTIMQEGGVFLACTSTNKRTEKSTQVHNKNQGIYIIAI